MSQTTLPPYAPLAEFLFDAGSYVDACELHGMLCGFICGGLIAPNAGWMALLLAGAEEERRTELEICVNTLFKISLDQLSSFGFDFEVLLPIPESGQNLLLISSLSKWCEHFLLALGIVQEGKKMKAAKGKKTQELKEMKEAKSDIHNISRIYNQVLQSHEDCDEESFSSLLEHVRVSVMLIFTELNGRIRPTQH